MKNLLQFGALDCIEISTTREAEFAKMNRYLVLDHERFLLRQWASFKSWSDLSSYSGFQQRRFINLRPGSRRIRPRPNATWLVH